MKQLLAVLSIFLLTSVARAQQPTIVGRVIDATSKDGVIAARITFDPEFLNDSLKIALKGKGTKSRDDGSFVLATPDTGAYVLEIKQPGYQAAYVEFQSRYITNDTLYAQLEREQNDDVIVTAKASAKTIEDLCCRVEELNAELTNVAPFTPDMQQVMSRYSTCTSGHVNCTLDHSQTVRLRGMENPYTLMLLDGVPLFSAITTQYGMQMIPALATDNARIIEGASTSIYGNNAMAGVLSFDLKQPTQEREIFLQSNLASSTDHGLEGAYDLNASYRNANERTGIAAVASYNAHPFEPDANSIFANAPGLDRLSGYLTIYHKIGDDGARLKLTALGARDVRNVVIANTDTAYGANYDLTNGNLNLIGRVELPLGDLTALNLTGALAEANHGMIGKVSYLADKPVVGYEESTLESKVRYLQALMTTAAGDHFVTSTAEMRFESTTGILPGNPIQGLFAGPLYEFYTASASAEDQVSLGETWTALLGARFDHHSTAGNAISPRASVSFKPSADWRFRVMAGQGIKGQALFNEDHRIMHGLFAYQYNDDFKYEKSLSLNYDMSYTYTIGDEIGGQLNVNTFYSNITGKAMPQADSLANGKIFFVNNPNPARLMGVEIQTRPSFSEYFSGSLAFSVVNLTQINADGVRERVPLSPTINADASLMYHDNASEFAAEVWGSIIGKQRLPENPFGVETSPVTALLNLRLQKEIGMLTLHAGMLNILDTKQTDTMPFAYTSGQKVVSTIGFGPLEGREFFAGVRVTLGSTSDH